MTNYLLKPVALFGGIAGMVFAGGMFAAAAMADTGSGPASVPGVQLAHHGRLHIRIPPRVTVPQRGGRWNVCRTRWTIQPRRGGGFQYAPVRTCTYYFKHPVRG